MLNVFESWLNQFILSLQETVDCNAPIPGFSDFQYELK